MTRPARILATLILIALLTGCSSTRPARDVQPTGFLGADAALLHKGGEGEPGLVYRNPDADWASYNRILLDPVTFWRAPGSDDIEVSVADRQILVNYFHELIYNRFSKDFEMVNNVEPRTLRVRIAIVKAEKSYVVLDTVSTVIPQLRVLSGLKDLVTGKPAFVGEAEIAFRITDAASGKLLAAGVADRVGGKTLNAAHLHSWGDVEEAFKYWVNHAAFKLCKLQNRAGCTPPA